MTNLIVAKQLTKEFQKYKAIENLNLLNLFRNIIQIKW